MGFLNFLKRKKSEEKWVVIKPVKIKTDEEKPMVIKNDDEPRLKRMSKEELKKYFPNLEFD